jgi:hypothetical protein
MKFPQALVGSMLSAAALATASGAALADAAHVHLDEETTIGGVDVACTGVGQTKNLPKWSAYPVRVEFANAQHDYVAGETLTLSDRHGKELLQIVCDGPWVLLKLPPGKAYRVDATLAQPGVGPRSAMVKAPRSGQTRFVLTFPDAH